MVVKTPNPIKPNLIQPKFWVFTSRTFPDLKGPKRVPRFGHQEVLWPLQPHEAALGSAGREFGKAAVDGTVAWKTLLDQNVELLEVLPTF